MLPQRNETVSRRGFIVALTATTVAASAFALLARETNAAPVPTDPRAESLRVLAPLDGQHDGTRNQSIRSEGAREMTQQSNVQRASSTPTVVLVHGAFAESASWNGVMSQLLAEG